MISVKKTKIKPKVLNNNEWIQTKLLKIKDKDKPGKEIENKYNDKEVRNILSNLYKNKCAYCEKKIIEGKQIDHYRPKNGIKEIKNHKGYFWLGYEWTNLLPTCANCNNSKSNKFPLEKGEKTRISDDLEKEGFLKNNEFIFENFKIENLKREKRLLLNPEIDTVEEHLFFLPTGEIKSLSKKGEKSIEVYGLNRNTLILLRKKIIDDIIWNIFDIYSNYQSTSHYDMLRKLWNDKIEFTDKSEYSRFHYFIYNFFDFFIIDIVKDLLKTQKFKI